MNKTSIEEWRPVPDWPYEVSSLGRVRRTGRSQGARPGHILSPRLNDGYPRIGLRGGPRQRWDVYVHQLVALAFIGPCPDGHQVNHKNGIKPDNRPENLEYVTPAENMQHADANGLYEKARGERHGSAKLSVSDVRRIRSMAREGVASKEIAGHFDVCYQHVWDIVKGRKWSHVSPKAGVS